MDLHRAVTDGRVHHDGPVVEAAADDHGHLTHRRPSSVVEAGSARDVAAVLRLCTDRGIPVAPRGQGHSTDGQAQAGGGVVIGTGALRAVEWDRDHRVRVQAGALWSQVLDHTLQRGRAPRVLTDYLELSVGGTLSAGGLGGAGHRYGAQTDGVTELQVVTGAGEVVTCSPADRAALFHAVLAGLGQCAVITRATIETVPVPERLRRYVLEYPDPAALMADQRRAAAGGRFAYIEGQALPAPGGGWRYVLEVVAYPDDHADPGAEGVRIGDLGHRRGTEEVTDPTFAEFAHRMDEGVAYLRSTGEWYDPHPWWNALLPGSTAEAAVAEVFAELTPADLGPSGLALLYPIARPRTRLLRSPDEPQVFLLSLLKTASPGSGVPTAQAMVAANRRHYEKIRAHGGFQYPVGSIPMSGEDWREHYGPHWPDLAAAKREYDPANVLTPGPGIPT